MHYPTSGIMTIIPRDVKSPRDGSGKGGSKVTNPVMTLKNLCALSQRGSNPAPRDWQAEALPLLQGDSHIELCEKTFI